MSWSKSFSSLKEFNDATCPDDIDEDQWDAAVAAAKAIIKSGVIGEAKSVASHIRHEDNKPDRVGGQLPQATYRININGHSGSGPASVGCTVSEV